jgi:hypothetical protein
MSIAGGETAETIDGFRKPVWAWQGMVEGEHVRETKGGGQSRSGQGAEPPERLRMSWRSDGRAAIAGCEN